MTNGFVRVPPDSTGKRLHTQEHTVDGNQVQAQVYHLGSGDDVNNLQYVDNRGQASVRFAEGSPGMDAFGNLRTTNARMIGAYEYTNGDMSDLFSDTETLGGSVTYAPTASEMHLSVTGDSGSEAKRSTNRYHYYQPGVGNLIIMTLALSDSGKAGNIRGWGYADMSNGLFFRLNGTTMQVGIRSNTTGTVVNTVVDQANWNGDKLDGTGKSGVTLDVTKANFYWIDFAWLGVGAVRFGILAPDGSRTVCHTFENPNNNLGAYMASGSLPLSFHNYNVLTTSGTSEMKLICSAVYSESDIDYTYWRYSDADSGAPKAVGTSVTPIVSLKPTLTVNGKPNRIGLYPQCLSFYVAGGPVKVTIYDDVTLTGASWTAAESAAEYDITATAMSGGSKFHTYYLDAGSHHIEVSDLYESNDEGYHVLADSSGTYVMTIGMSKMNAGDTVTASATINYRELR